MLPVSRGKHAVKTTCLKGKKIRANKLGNSSHERLACAGQFSSSPAVPAMFELKDVLCILCINVYAIKYLIHGETNAIVFNIRTSMNNIFNT